MGRPKRAADEMKTVPDTFVHPVGDGCALVDDAEYRRRLGVCHFCDRRTERRCTACGCWIGLKARGRAFTCPLGRWKQQDRKSEIRMSKSETNSKYENDENSNGFLSISGFVILASFGFCDSDFPHWPSQAGQTRANLR